MTNLPHTGERSEPDSWLALKHPEYRRSLAKWNYARDHYTGEVLDDEKIKKYLVKRAQGESKEAFAERVKLADYTPHFAAVVDSLAGMLFNVEENANRSFGGEDGDGLGHPDDPSTLIGRLWQDADMKGTGYPTLFKQAATELIYLQRLWCLVEGGQTGDARIRLIPPQAVDNWREEDGRIVEAKLVEEIDTRSSLRDDPEHKDAYLYFTTDGWVRYTLEEDAEGKTYERELGSGSYSFEDPAGNPILPLFAVDLPLNRMVGYLLARKANAIFNKESHRDHLLTVAHFPKLNVVAVDELFEKIVDSLKKGSNVLQNDPNYGSTHGYIHPSAEPAKVLSDVLQRKVDEFWRTAFREYGDSAQERTATEVRQDVAGGVGAFLQLLKAAVDDLENQVLWRLAQVEFPEDRNRWFKARVERSDDFLPPDIDIVLETKRKRYFGETTPVPLGRQGRIQVVKQIAEYDGLKLSDEEISAAVDAQAFKDTMGLFDVLPFPAEVKVALVTRTLQALDIFEPDEEITLDSGETVKVIEAIREAARDLAEAKDDAAVRMGRGGF